MGDLHHIQYLQSFTIALVYYLLIELDFIKM